MQYSVKYPSARTAEVVRYYWVIEGTLAAPMVQRVIPSGEPQLLFHYGNPFGELTGCGEELAQPRFSICGQTTRFKDVLSRGVAGTIGVVFKPFGLASMLSIPADELTDCSVSASDISRPLADIGERLSDAQSLDDRIRLLDYEFSKIFISGTDRWFSLIKYSVDRVIGQKGIVPVKQLIQETGVGERQLERAFKKMVGIAPSKFIAYTRLNHIKSLLETPMKLTDVALEAGFYDQSHFIRTFRNLTGYSPKEFRRIQ